MPLAETSAADLDLAVAVLDLMEVPRTETNVKQFLVFRDAMDIFVQRNDKRADLWRQFGWQDSALHIRSKAARVALTLERDLDIDPADVLDDAHDLINVAAFFIRNVLDPA